MQQNQTPQKSPESLSEILKKFNLAHPGEENNNLQQTLTATKISDTPSKSDIEMQQNPPVDPEDDNDDYFISRPINSAFEINIAEFPIAYLNRGQLPEGVSKTKYQYQDVIKGRNGEPVERTWTIEAHATEEIKNELGKNESVNLGFGGPATLELIYELFQLWKEQGFKEPKIHIGTFYNLLKRLGWGQGTLNINSLKKFFAVFMGCT